MQEHISYKIQNNYTFRFGQYLKKSFELIRKEMPLFLGFSALFAVITTLLPLIPILGGLASTFFIIPVLSAGYFFAAHKIDNGEKVVLKDFFAGFKIVKPLALINLSLLIFLIFAGLTTIYLLSESTSLMSLPSEILSMSNKIENFSDLPVKQILIALSLIVIAPSLLFGIYILSVPFLLFENIDFWTAMQSSRAVALKKVFYLLLVVLLGSIIFYAIQYGLFFAMSAASVAKVSIEEGATETLEAQNIKDLLMPSIKLMGKILLFQGFSKVISFLLLPFYYCFVYAFYKDIVSENDVFEEEM